jgi:hypothetical protein
MPRKIYLLLFLQLAISSVAIAQIFPAENSKVNYRLVGFSFPAEKGISEYSVEIAIGNYTNGDFTKNIIQTGHTHANRVVAEVPFFGRDYTWRTSFNAKGKTTFSKLHHFSSIISGEVDSSVTRLTILKAAEKYKDAYVFADGSSAMYNMSGKPVWYLPLTGKLNPKKNKVMDLKLTPQGTITFLLGQNIYEVNYSGDILWEGPDNGKTTRDSNAHYHHEFTRLHNGHYMVLGNEFVKMPHPVSTDNGNAKKADSTAAFGTVVEYDQKGKTVWSWRSADFFKTVPPQYLASDLYDPTAPQGTDDVHENAFYFDEAEKAVYVSFKNISSILKVKYPEGNVVGAYGKLAGFFGANTARLFCGQHSCKTTTNGKLYLFNNNTCNKGALPQIQLFQQPADNHDTLKMLWQYTCNFDDVIALKQQDAKTANTDSNFPSAESLAPHGIFSKGGNLISLPDNSIFASICGPYGKMFIISPDKKIEWSALLETWNLYDRKWDDLISYKANIVTDPKDIERLIWNSVPK